VAEVDAQSLKALDMTNLQAAKQRSELSAKRVLRALGQPKEILVADPIPAFGNKQVDPPYLSILRVVSRPASGVEFQSTLGVEIIAP
jgi:hypothetical protein